MALIAPEPMGAFMATWSLTTHIKLHLGHNNLENSHVLLALIGNGGGFFFLFSQVHLSPYFAGNICNN